MRKCVLEYLLLRASELDPSRAKSDMHELENARARTAPSGNATVRRGRSADPAWPPPANLLR
jgi:hypothetical protein